MWIITTINNEEHETPFLRCKTDIIELIAAYKVKNSYDKKTGFLWWKKIETITESKEEKYPFGFIPLNRIKDIFWQDSAIKKEEKIETKT